MNMKFFTLLLAAASVLLLTACTSIDAVPLPMNAKIQSVKIIENPENNVIDFVPVCQENLEQYGIESRLFPPDYEPKKDECIMTYWTERSWDMKMFLKKAHIELIQNKRIIASGDFNHIGGMLSFAPTKLKGTSWKMVRVFNQMMRYHNKVKKYANINIITNDDPKLMRDPSKWCSDPSKNTD